MYKIFEISEDGKTLLECLDKNITTAIIPKGIKSIGVNAFWGCKFLENIDIPNGVENIERDAFNGCTSLQIIKLPNSIIHIGSCAFSNCSALQIINIPNNLPYIDDCTFSFCTSLWKITLPDSITSIGKGVFIGCKKLMEITIPNNIKLIDDGAFYGCKSLKKINIPRTIIKFGDDVFKDCTSLNNIYIACKEINKIKGLDSVFKDIDFETCFLHIPSEKKSAYINHPILGKFKNIITDDWKLVANSKYKLAKQQLCNTIAVVFKSKLKLIARITIGQQYTDFIVDENCKLKAGDTIEPSSIRVYKLINKEGLIIKRLWGEAQKENRDTTNSEKKTQEIKWRTIKVNPNPLIDFSGDDLSLDPRFW